MQMHHRNDQNLAFLHRVNDAVRKAMRAATADFRIKWLPGFRPFEDAGNGLADFLKEIMAEPGNLGLLIPPKSSSFAGETPGV
jgi:hypothetical protein